MSEKPFIEPPTGPVPAELQIIDEVVGEGKEATRGATVFVDYVGVGFDSGEEFDASYNRGEPLAFRLGIGQVIKGWDDGVLGMKVGGRRRLVIPAHLAYGRRGVPGVIGPNEALIFVCELRDVR
ncbi:FKBP-type peptidyl-prolyl cis-trans isomerase [Brooklawnia cerclae]|uniref:Peptidyl-prolyl cis-trans isomerase n=1 Tax=Brooklawnia cerclae TaxID=349934 RepID=A0ABX0SJV0_9ACTN|nr:FKBP-type peptidyl-prolyl cis-trans isomerase [Brooklawnia cerclae]NIH58199.1 peptidylprolyl isomerase [Brooklawnia cerclae]